MNKEYRITKLEVDVEGKEEVEVEVDFPIYNF